MVVTPLISKEAAKLHPGMWHLGNSPCFHPELSEEAHRQLQPPPAAEKSHLENPDGAAACSPWGHG